MGRQVCMCWQFWVPCCRQASWSISVYYSSHYLVLNLFLHRYFVRFTGQKGLSKQSWGVVGCKLVSKHCWSCWCWMSEYWQWLKIAWIFWAGWAPQEGTELPLQHLAQRNEWENVAELSPSSYEKKMSFWHSVLRSRSNRFREEFVLSQCNSFMNAMTVQK